MKAKFTQKVTDFRTFGLCALFCLVSILLTRFDIYAQSTESVRVSIIFHPIQKLTINPEQTNISLEYRTLEDYQRGVESTQRNHLTILSTGPYEVKVRLGLEDPAENTAGTHDVPNIRVSALPNAHSKNTNLQSQHLLNPVAHHLISSHHAAIDIPFDIRYEGMGNLTFASQLTGNDIKTSENIVVYSIETK